MIGTYATCVRISMETENWTICSHDTVIKSHYRVLIRHEKVVILFGSIIYVYLVVMTTKEKAEIINH